MASPGGMFDLCTRISSSKAGIQGPGVERPRSCGRVAWASGPVELGVAQALVAEGVGGSAEQEGGGDDCG